MVQALAFTFLQMQISESRSVAGISGKALTMHAAKLCCRLCSSLFLDGYLPTDKSGDWIYQLGTRPCTRHKHNIRSVVP